MKKEDPSDKVMDPGVPEAIVGVISYLSLSVKRKRLLVPVNSASEDEARVVRFS